MDGPAGGPLGPLVNPNAPTPPTTPLSDLGRITRATAKGHKRRSPDVDTSFTRSPELLNLEFVRGGTETATSLDDLAALKETITKQSHIIESFRGDLAEVKDQNVKLGEEVKLLRAHLDAHSIPPPTTRTWATVTASSNGTCQSSGSTPLNNKSPEASAKEAHCVRINTKPRDTQTDTENLTFTRYLPT